MKYIYVIDTDVKDHLTSLGYKMLKQQNTMSGEMVWIFEDNQFNPFCFDIGSSEYKSKCFVADKLTMSF